MMPCNSKMSKRKKIAVLAASFLASIIAIYFAFILHNPALAIVAPVFLAFLPCLIMCGIVGGSMWLVPRLSKNQDQSSRNCGFDHSTKQKESK